MKTLSEKTEICEYPKGFPIGKWIRFGNVKEFIKELKEAFPINCKEHHRFHDKIEKLAGADLI